MFQAVTTPDGLCAHRISLDVGSNNTFLLAELDVKELCGDKLEIGELQYVLYGDSRYSARETLEISFGGGDMK